MIQVEHPRWTTTSHKRSRTKKKNSSLREKNTIISTSRKLPSNLSDWSMGVVHVLSSESFFKIYCKEAVYIEVVGDVATTCLSWKQVCLHTSERHVYFETLRFISKWEFHPGKVTKDVWNSENNLYVSGKFSACLITIKLLGTYQASPAHYMRMMFFTILTRYVFFRRRLHAGNSVLRLFYFILYYLETSCSA